MPLSVPRITAPGSLSPFQLANARGTPRWQTHVSLAWDDFALRVSALCEDDDAWGTHTTHDAPLWEEEAFEIFIAAGEANPARYFELEVSPRSTVFDAVIHNPTGLRRDLVADLAWSCTNLRCTVEATGRNQDWRVELAIPWSSLLDGGPRPSVWRLNFYRIERPRGGRAEFSCWSPTHSDPPDFHRPQWFGVLDLG